MQWDKEMDGYMTNIIIAVYIFYIIKKKKNYLNFGKPGGRSITSFREFFYRFNQINSSLFLPKVKAPKEMIFFFYEGNDLQDNYKFFKKNNIKNISIKDFVYNEIENYENYKLRKFNIYFPIVTASKKILLEKFIHHFYLPYARKKLEKENLKKDNNEIKLEETVTNEIKFNNKILRLKGNIENPGYFLNENELDISINIFFSCLDYFKNKFPETKITILYIPSPASIYNWNFDLKIKNNTNKILKINDETILNKYNYIISKFKIYSKQNDIKFLNSTNKLKEYSINEFLHGKYDRDHFNVKGYEILANVIFELNNK